MLWGDYKNLTDGQKIIDNAIFAELNWLDGHAFVLISETNQLIKIMVG